MGIFSKNKTVSIQEAKLQFNKGNHRKALKLCKDFLSTHENDFEGLNLLGDIYFKLNDKSNSLDTYRKLISQLETERYTDKAIAVIRKIIRQFPDQYDLYRKLSKLFEKKGFAAEQLKILYELSSIYQENKLDDKAIEILKEIVEIDRTNLGNFVKIMNTFHELKKKFEINKLIYPALELAKEKKNDEATTTFVEIAIENKTDLADSIKFTAAYFRSHPEHIDVFNSNATESLNKEFDKLLFTEFISLNDYSQIAGSINELKSKYQEISIYDYLLEQQLKSGNPANFISLLNEILGLPDYLFDASYAEVLGKYVDSVSDVESLDIMVTIAGKCNAKDLQIIIYKKLSQLHRSLNDIEKADRITEYINDLEYSDTSVSAGIAASPFGETQETVAQEDEASIADLLESTSYEDNASDGSDDGFDFDIDLDDDDDGSISDFDLDDKDDGSIGDFDLDDEDDGSIGDFDIEMERVHDEEEIDQGEAPQTEPEVSSLNTNEDGFDINLDDDDFELVIDEEDDLEVSLDDDSTELDEFELDDIPDETDIFGDIDVEVDVDDNQISDDDLIRVNSLIESGDKEKAKQEIEQLLLKQPDHPDLKSLASMLLQDDIKPKKKASGSDIENDQLEDMIYSFKSVADNIRKSIDAQISPDDYETHYDLAMAYMEMELFDEALEELKKSATGNKKYESLFLMAECYKRMTLFDDALNIHKLIIIDYNDQEKLKNSLYEMAIISEMKGDAGSSNNFFQKISRLDPEFRDVKSRLNGSGGSSSEIFQEDDEIPIVEETAKSKKKKKISFL